MAISFYGVIPLDKANNPHTGLFKWNAAENGLLNNINRNKLNITNLELFKSK